MAGHICWDDTGWIGQIMPLLRAGGVVLGPTDTVPGLLAVATAEGAAALDRAKVRSGGKPYLILVGSSQQALDLMDREKVADNTQINALMDRCWPGPLTLLVPAGPSVPTAMTLNGSIAIRLPNYLKLQELALAVGPLFSTSANKESEPTPRCMDEVNAAIKSQAAVLISGVAQTKCDARPSTILDCSGGVIKVVRAGAYSIEELAKIVPIST